MKNIFAILPISLVCFLVSAASRNAEAGAFTNIECREPHGDVLEIRTVGSDAAYMTWGTNSPEELTYYAYNSASETWHFVKSPFDQHMFDLSIPYSWFGPAEFASNEPTIARCGPILRHQLRSTFVVLMAK